MQLDKAIQDRLSVRKFLDKKPDWRIIIECINASRYAPMAGGNFSLKVIMIDDQEKIQQIAKAAQQDFISRAHYLVVFCSDKGRTTNAYGKRGEIYARQQAGAAIQNKIGQFISNPLVRNIIGQPKSTCRTEYAFCLIQSSRKNIIRQHTYRRF